ncbi:unnamed protein product [Calicophoron daubneyi]|uniref:Apoptosis inhibitor 5 n=1 Tax=Calicophoron daubneyi TaxID=300641 RepID=A0AAV2TMY9_CALDB
MSAPTLAELYSHYETLCNESSTHDEKEAAYHAFLSGTKGGEKEKRLACQFIARFSKQFDSLKEESFNCILDLCDDDDINIRKQAIHDLLQFCKRIRAFVPRVADVLVQMFQTEDASELHLISSCLSQLLNIDPKSALAGVFNQMLTVNPDHPRDHIMKFLADNLKIMPEELLTSDVEEFVVEQINKVLRDVSEEEFLLLVAILSSLRCMSTVPGRQKLVSMITDQALQAVPEFNPTDPACVAQIRESCKQAAMCVSKNVRARELYLYLLQNVMPNLTKIPDSIGDDKLSLLRITAELTATHEQEFGALPADDMDKYLTTIYDILVGYLPEIPQTVSETESSSPEAKSGAENTEKPSFPPGLRLSELECLLYIICHLARCRAQFFGEISSEQRDEAAVDTQNGYMRLRTIRPRLQYLNQIAQEYSHSLASHLGENGQGDDDKLKIVAHRLVSNIQVLVRCFFHNPPVFKTSITLSWLQTHVTVSPGTKRSAPASIGGSEMAKSNRRKEQPRYTPPVGQWSHQDQSSWSSGGNRLNRNTRGRRRKW